MRMETPWRNNHLIIVDDESLFQGLRKHQNYSGEEAAVGAAFSTCYARLTPHTGYYLLYQEPENAHLRLWLALAVLTKHARFQTIIALGKGLNLSKHPQTAEPLLITEARACTYPALYQNENPYRDGTQPVEIYKPAPLAEQWISSHPKGITDIAAIAGYCKHPVHNGSLLPWAPEQFQQMSNQGIQVYSEVPAGIYDTREIPAYHQTTMPAFCMITENLDDQYSNPTELADWLMDTQHRLIHSKSTGSTSTIS